MDRRGRGEMDDKLGPVACLVDENSVALAHAK